ncbi:MAG: tRNA (adenosine(37)-N6)-dimethylallyltransferase MiaA [Gammaproteobacteria bacterium]|nr:tRNA (adenosine(37)-N6)-dimethylallyltransferase MiaA [Gammaproteobacteria bacterium]
MDEQRAVCIMGPTGAGKTDLALALCECGPFEIISVDSGMIYRGLTIGTAKPSPSVLARAPHHLIDVVDADRSYSAAAFRADAQALMADIAGRGRIPLLVGGTGLYFRALMDGLDVLPAADVTVRQGLESELAANGLGALYQRLREGDPATARRLHQNDTQRILRALEILQITGRPMSEHLSDSRPQVWRPTVAMAVAPSDRAVLHERISRRYHAMLDRGLINEVRWIRERFGDVKTLPGLKLVGYRNAAEYVAGACDWNEMIARGIAATRQLARRQLTWLRADETLTWVDSSAANHVEMAIKRISSALFCD